MKAFFNICVILSLAVLGSAINVANVLKIQQPFLLEKPAIAKGFRLPIALPNLGRIFLFHQKPLEAQLIRLDPKQRKSTLQNNAGRQEIDTRNLNKVQFNRRAPYRDQNGDMVLRGSRSNVVEGKPVVWENLPLSALQIKNSSLGEAEVVLDDTLVNVDRSNNTTYVLDEIQFNQQNGTVTIVATPYTKIR